MENRITCSLKYFFFFMSLLCFGCIHKKHEPRRLLLEAKFDGGKLIVPNLYSFINGKKGFTGSSYLVYGIHLSEVCEKKISKGFLWKVSAPFDDIYSNLNSLPELPDSVFLGKNISGLEENAPPNDFMMQPNCQYQVVICVISLNSMGEKMKDFRLIANVPWSEQKIVLN